MTRPRYTLRLAVLTLAILAGFAAQKGRDLHAATPCHRCIEAGALS